jgi:hypothetical protein
MDLERAERASEGVRERRRGDSPRDMSVAVRALLRALRDGKRPGAKTTATQLEDLARLCRIEAGRRRRRGSREAGRNGGLPTVALLRGDELLKLDDLMAAYPLDSTLRVTVERVA